MIGQIFKQIERFVLNPKNQPMGITYDQPAAGLRCFLAISCVIKCKVFKCLHNYNMGPTTGTIFVTQ